MQPPSWDLMLPLDIYPPGGVHIWGLPPQDEINTLKPRGVALPKACLHLYCLGTENFYPLSKPGTAGVSVTQSTGYPHHILGGSR